MAKVSSIPSLPRATGAFARAWPIATVGVAALLPILPLHVPGLAELTPAFALMAVYHWAVYRPDLLPPSGLFAVGLAQDLLSGGLVGVGALVLLLARTAMLHARGHLINRGFAFVWAGFALLSLALLAGVWALHCAVDLMLFDPRGTVFRAVLTVAIFPAASFVLGRSQRALVGAG